MAKSSGSASGRNFVLADVIGGAIIIAVGLGFIANAMQFGIFGEGGRLAPGAMPFFSGLALAVCGLGVAVTSFSKAARQQQVVREEKAREVEGSPDPGASEVSGTEVEAARTVTDTSQTSDGDDREGEIPARAAEDRSNDTDLDLDLGSEPDPGMGKAMVVLAAAVVATWLASRIGFLVAFALLLFGLWVGLEREKPLKALVITAGVILFTYLLFIQFLRIPVPEAFFL